MAASVLGAVCGCAGTRPVTSPKPLLSAAETKAQTRNNAASLLFDVLDDERNVDKVLVIKSARPEVVELIKLISATAATHRRELEELATNDVTLRLDAMNLPPGEAAARDGTAKSKEHDLLFSTGANFEFNLLYSQAEAENYGWHLARVAAENAERPEEKRVFDTISQTMERLNDQVVTKLRATTAR